MIGRESPHDHWADMGLDDSEHRRVDPEPPEPEPETCSPWWRWDCTEKRKEHVPSGFFTADELEFMDAIGE